jgi:hypothetical protein
VVTTNLNRKDAGAPVMLWVRSDDNDHAISPATLEQYCEVLIVDSMEKGVDALVHQPVDILIVELTQLTMADPELIDEISRCWPYLLCLVLSDEQVSDADYAEQHDLPTVLYMPKNSETLKQQLMISLGQVANKTTLH